MHNKDKLAVGRRRSELTKHPTRTTWGCRFVAHLVSEAPLDHEARRDGAYEHGPVQSVNKDVMLTLIELVANGRPSCNLLFNNTLRCKVHQSASFS